MSSLVQMDKAVTSNLSLPDHLKAIVPDVIRNDPKSKLLFLAEGLKDENTGKKTSTREMTSIGVWEDRDPKESTIAKGKDNADRMLAVAIQFIDR